ncbi:MAG: peptidase M28 [Planctomycetes bacterium]|nr:peptidase M28 [Planctomycetota bacterium]
MTRSLAFLILVATTAVAQHPASAVEHLIDRESIAGPMSYLSDDLLEGRQPGTRGGALARLYIRTQFESYGVKPAGRDGSWDQPVPIIGITSTVTRALGAVGKNGAAAFTAPTDYTAQAGKPVAGTEWKDAPLVFVGYGIHAPEQNWDDYKDTDVKGKVVLVMNNDPADDPNLFAGKTRLYYGRWSYKFEEAARRGAIGCVVIHTTPSAGYPFQVIQATHGRERFFLPFDDKTPTLSIRSWCSNDAAVKLCKLGGFDLDGLRKKAETREFSPVELGVKIDLATKNRVREIQSANVLGKIDGAGPQSDEVVVVTAHFDHLGRGRPVQKDEIYNGALDNASGSAALLSLARACSHLPSPPRRTILFTAVTAEESGLLGSLYFARHPTVPRRKMIANFNIDGINIWGPTKDIAMIGHGKNSLTDVADRVAKRRGRVLVPNPEVDKGLFYRSDHFSFARVGVPSAYFKAGHDFYERASIRRRVKLSYTGTHYHQPSDEFDARWNLDGAVHDVRLMLECLLTVVGADEEPRWAKGDEFEKLR